MLTLDEADLQTILHSSFPQQRVALTLGPAYNEFGYNEHLAIMSNFLPEKKITSD